MAERRNSPGGRLSPMEMDGEYTMRHRAPLIHRSVPIKTALMAAFLLIGGIIFLSVGASILWASLINNGRDRGIALMALGGLMFTPGSYATLILVGSYLRWENYDYSMIPSYDD